jgi:hypothetical protein
MKRTFAFVATAVALSGGLVLACNSILGIDAAQEVAGDASGDASPHEAGPPAGDGAAEASPAQEEASVNPYTLSCSNYCNLMSENCVDEGVNQNQEYLSNDVCTTICGQYESTDFDVEGGIVDPGQPTPMSNTLNCRIWHANAAATDPHVHCPHAGPLGGDMCEDMTGGSGSPCYEFCTLDLAFCTGDAAAYDGVQDCLNACLPDAGAPDAEAGAYPGYVYNINSADPEVIDLAASGDTLNCRMYHLENFLFTGESVHCSHTSLSGGGVCVGQ